MVTAGNWIKGQTNTVHIADELAGTSIKDMTQYEFGNERTGTLIVGIQIKAGETTATTKINVPKGIVFKAGGMGQGTYAAGATTVSVGAVDIYTGAIDEAGTAVISGVAGLVEIDTADVVSIAVTNVAPAGDLGSVTVYLDYVNGADR